MSEKPIKKFSTGNVQASIWRNQTMVNGAPKEFFSVSVERSYKDKQGNWNNTNSLRTTDIPKAQLALSEAYRFLNLKGLMPIQGQGQVPQEQAYGNEPQQYNKDFSGVVVENVA
ncbi:MAG: hypothetical protein KAS17_03510 [Victivallaceae bacterium]|nr:hypothetical protein [Victivallaceae bacterium]